MYQKWLNFISAMPQGVRQNLRLSRSNLILAGRQFDVEARCGNDPRDCATSTDGEISRRLSLIYSEVR
jgi:hypothetical protein